MQPEQAQDGSESRRIGRFVRLRFLAVLALLALLSVGAIAALHLMAQGQEQAAALINAVGRQRMLSQRIALDVLRLASTADAAQAERLRDDIQANVERLARTHRTLDYGMFDPVTAAAIERLRTEPPHALDVAVAEFRSRVDRALAAARAGRLAPDSAAVRAVIRQSTDRLLPGSEALTAAVEEGAQRRIEALRAASVLAEGLFLALLVVMGYGIFEPLLRHIRDVVARLASLHREHRAVVDAITDAIFEHVPDSGALRPLNPAARGLSGLTDGGSIPRETLLPQMPDPGRVAPADWSHRVVEGIGTDGRSLHLEVTVREAGRGRRILILRDISERVEAEQQVRTLLQALEDSPTSVVITDLDSTIRYVKRHFCEVSGYSREEALGAKPNILRSGLTPKETYASMWAALKRGERWRGEVLNRRKSGDLFWELMAVCPLFDSRGRPIQYIAVKEDITERKRMETELMEARRRAEEISQAKSTFLAGLSHELRTPLNAVIGFADVMSSEVFGPLGHEKYRSYVQGIHESGLHLLHLINDVLDLSKVEAGRMELREEEVDLHDAVGGVIRLMCDRAHRAGVRLLTEVEPGLPLVRADGVRLRQILLNLVSNAVKFTPSGGKVVVRVGLSPEGRLVITVRDTGVGIAPEEMGRIFEPFGQARNVMVSREEGTGLGLPLSRRLVELHGGTLTLDSEPGWGTQATITLPAERVTGRNRSRPLDRASADN